MSRKILLFHALLSKKNNQHFFTFFKFKSDLHNKNQHFSPNSDGTITASARINHIGRYEKNISNKHTCGLYARYCSLSTSIHHHPYQQTTRIPNEPHTTKTTRDHEDVGIMETI